MPDSLLQPSFAGGELSPSLYARVDLDRYGNSLKTCRNFITQVYGGAKNRPGTKFIAAAKYPDKKVRLIPFVFSKDQAYVLELGDRYLRAFYNGQPLAGATNRPNYGTITVTDLGGGSFGLVSELDTFASSDVGRQIKVFLSMGDVYTITGFTDSKTVTASGTASLSGLATTTSSTWLFVNNPAGQVLFETNTPWTDAELYDLTYVQSADVITVCHPSHPPQDIRRLADGTFQVLDTLIVNGPFQPVNIDKSITVTPSGVSGTVTLNASKPIFKADHVGVLFYIEDVSPAQLWKPGEAVSAGDKRMSDGKNYQAANGGTTGSTPPSHYDGTQSDGAVNWLYLDSGFGVCKITSVGTLANGYSSTATAVVNGRLPSSYSGITSLVATADSYAVSPASGNWVRVETSAAHGFPDGSQVSYTVLS